MKVIIAGSGIAGPAAAIALRRANIEAEILESRATQCGDEGLFLGLASNGHNILETLGLDAGIRSLPHFETPRIAFFSGRGKRLGGVTNGNSASAPPITLMRATLNAALAREAERQGIRIHRGRAVIGYRQDAKGVTIHCDDGHQQRADLLIGADGLRSKVRAAMPLAEVQPRYTCLLNLGGVVPGSGLPSTGGEMRMVWGSRAYFGYVVGETGEAWWFANIAQASEPRRRTPDAPAPAWRQELDALFADDLPLIRELIRRTPDIHAYPIHDLPHVPRWHDGRVVLIGDAAHATSPSSGQGASLALEDAAFLAICLRDIADPEAALARFEAVRRPRAERIVEAGHRRGSYKAPRSRLQMRLRDALMPAVLRLFATERSLSWIHDYRLPGSAL